MMSEIFAKVAVNSSVDFLPSKIEAPRIIQNDLTQTI